jgi:hypothetical protein
MRGVDVDWMSLHTIPGLSETLAVAQFQFMAADQLRAFAR